MIQPDKDPGLSMLEKLFLVNPNILRDWHVMLLLIEICVEFTMWLRSAQHTFVL